MIRNSEKWMRNVAVQGDYWRTIRCADLSKWQIAAFFGTSVCGYLRIIELRLVD